MGNKYLKMYTTYKLQKILFFSPKCWFAVTCIVMYEHNVFRRVITFWNNKCIYCLDTQTNNSLRTYIKDAYITIFSKRNPVRPEHKDMSSCFGATFILTKKKKMYSSFEHLIYTVWMSENISISVSNTDLNAHLIRFYCMLIIFYSIYY